MAGTCWQVKASVILLDEGLAAFEVYVISNPMRQPENQDYRFPSSDHSQFLATLLTGAWRKSPPPLEFSAEQLIQIAPLLLGSGAGALGWNRIRKTHLRETPAAFELRQAYRLHTLQAAVQEAQIQKVWSLLHAANIDPILIKGWSNARYYAEKGLRPYGDLDLCIRPGQYHKACAVFDCPPSPDGCTVLSWESSLIELHRGLTDLDDPADFTWPEVVGYAQAIDLGAVEVRVLSPEDHLRLVCLHFLRHGAWRPLWLCDIAALVESRTPDFDWQRCLGSNRRRADWVACAIGLAHQLLGLDVAATPVAKRAQHLPRWIVPAVLKAWQRPYGNDHQLDRPFATVFRNPAQLPHILRARWLGPIEATVLLRKDFNDGPKLPWQFMSYGWRVSNLCQRTLHQIKSFKPPANTSPEARLSDKSDL
ncbi:MAG: nucleotidyltransferase family protein [Abitibacteriaceae bacterium]|nr:nucleotidyltransferase family protein [Abditibacteriaceae bacterium]